MKPKRNLISAAVVLALAAASPAYAVLERMGPVDNSPTVGGFPSWFQDGTGITIEFCDLKTQAELDGGWCVLIPPGINVPEAFPDNYFGEHFYSLADNTLKDGNGFRARLTVALESAFVNGKVVNGDQMVFQRHRIFMPSLNLAGDYRIITPYGDFPFYGMQVGDRIFETQDVGVGCPTTFECALNGPQGPFLLPSGSAGGAEVPPMPDLAAAPPGTDPFYDQMVALAAGPTRDPGTGMKYLADPARIGAITGSPLPPLTVYDMDPDHIQLAGIPRQQDHNTFRIEVRHAQPDHMGELLLVADGTNQFTVSGRLHTGTIPGKVDNPRSTYKADASGNVTDLDVFAQVAATVQARLPAQPVLPRVTPVVGFYDQPCAGAIGVDANGLPVVNPGPYTAPAGTPTSLANTGKDFWGQSSPGGLPPSHVCVEDTTSRNAAGQIVPTYTLVPVTDHVIVNSAHYVGPENGTMTVTAVSSDPTAILTLQGYGPAGASPGVSTGVGAGTGLDLQGTAAQVIALKAPPSAVQVVSTKGGSALRKVDTAHGTAQLVGQPSAVNDSATVYEDCSPTPALACAAGQGVTVDLLANDTVMLNGVMANLRDVVSQGLATVTVAAQTPRLGAATVSADGFLTYIPNPNANGTDNVNYTVTVDGQLSNQAVAAITITPVNDLPVAGNSTIGAVAGKTNVMNLLKNATDPDGNADVVNAVITNWPPILGPQPVPANGVISFVPTATGSVTVSYQVKDASGVLSANIGAGTVTVISAESISYTKNNFTKGNVGGAASARWVVSGNDTVRQGQTLTIAYLDGTIRATNQSCNGTAAIPACVIGTAVVDPATGAWLFDRSNPPGGATDPTDTTFWSSGPKNIRTFSSSPNLGGAQPIGIVFK